MTSEDERKELMEDGEEYHKQQWEENNDLYSLNWLARKAIAECKEKVDQMRKDTEDVEKVCCGFEI